MFNFQIEVASGIANLVLLGRQSPMKFSGLQVEMLGCPSTPN